MDNDFLRDHLKNLHEELTQATHVDPGSSQLLGELMSDIKRLTGESPASAADAAPDRPEGLADRLEEVAVQFEAKHPTLAASSRRLVDLLGKAGL